MQQSHGLFAIAKLLVIPYERKIRLVFRHEQWLVGMSRSTWNFGSNWPPPLASKSIFARSASALTASEKYPIMTNRKSTTSFPMRLRWTAYVAPKPPKGAQRRKLVIFLVKAYFFGRKSATQFLYVKTSSGKVVRHSLADLDVQKWLVGDVPFYVKFCTKVTHPLQKRRYISLVPHQP